MLKYLLLLLCISSIYGFENIVSEFTNDGHCANLVEVDASNDFVTSILEPHTQPFQVRCFPSFFEIVLAVPVYH